MPEIFAHRCGQTIFHLAGREQGRFRSCGGPLGPHRVNEAGLQGRIQARFEVAATDSHSAFRWQYFGGQTAESSEASFHLVQAERRS